MTCLNGYKPCALDCIPNSSSCNAGWRQLSPATSPPARSHAAMAYDSQRQRVVLFGGWNGANFDDTWEFNGSNWVQKTPANKPTARDSAAMAYHASSQKIVMFGGFDGSAQALGDTWLWDGTNWTQPVIATPSPSARYGAAVTYDSLTSSVVLFGGRYSASSGTGTNYNDVWMWSGTGWSQCTTTTLCPGTPPSARLGAGAVRDNNQLVVFGGGTDWDMTSTYGDMYALGLGGWSSLAVSRPPARGFMGFAWDAHAGNGVLFGGFTSQNVVIGDTWTWGSGAWTQLSPTASPTARGAPAMAYDAQRQVTVLFGGSNGDMFFPTYYADTWELVQ